MVETFFTVTYMFLYSVEKLENDRIFNKLIDVTGIGLFNLQVMLTTFNYLN